MNRFSRSKRSRARTNMASGVGRGRAVVRQNRRLKRQGEALEQYLTRHPEMAELAGESRLEPSADCNGLAIKEQDHTDPIEGQSRTPERCERRGTRETCLEREKRGACLGLESEWICICGGCYE